MSAPDPLFARADAARAIAFARVVAMGEQRLREMNEAAKMAPREDWGKDAVAYYALKGFIDDVRRELALPAPCICGDCNREIAPAQASGFRQPDAHPVHMVCPDALR